MVRTSGVQGLEPPLLWQRFIDLTRIARPSRFEELAIGHVQRWADARGYARWRDAARNTVIRVPATAGREDAPVLILQGHLDMICERLADTRNDASAGRIALRREGDWLCAVGTTLGADGGLGIAAMMALAEDDTAPHGPLELLMTVGAEADLEGARGLDAGLLTGRSLLSLDGEEDGVLVAGCAGCADTRIRIDGHPRSVRPGSIALAIDVRGGRGGHPGRDVGAGRANAIKVLGGVLREASEAVPLRVVALNGGTALDAIPREAHALCVVGPGDEGPFRAAADAAARRLRRAFAAADPAIAITLPPVGKPWLAWDSETTARVLDAIALIPSGPLAPSPALPGLVETSTLLAQAVTDGGALTLASRSLSLNDAYLPEVLGGLAAVARQAGAAIDVRHNHPAWPPDRCSALVASASAVHRRLFGTEPRIAAIHAGLEPAVIGGKLPGLDMLAIGPRIEHIHTPAERVSIAAVERFWRLLLGIADAHSAPVSSAAPPRDPGRARPCGAHRR